MRAHGDDALLDGLLCVLLGGVELLLEQLDLAVKTLVGGPAGVAVREQGLVLCELGLCLLEVCVEDGELVLEREDLLVLLEDLLLELLVLCLCVLCARDGVVGLLPQLGETLCTARGSDGGTGATAHGPLVSCPWSMCGGGCEWWLSATMRGAEIKSKFVLTPQAADRSVRLSQSTSSSCLSQRKASRNVVNCHSAATVFGTLQRNVNRARQLTILISSAG